MVKVSAMGFPAKGRSAAIRPYRKNLLGAVKKRFAWAFSQKRRRPTWKAAMRLLQPLSSQNYTDSADTEFDSMRIPSVRRF
jgi:hypothetical protein